jgi:hypothetical protein
VSPTEKAESKRGSDKKKIGFAHHSYEEGYQRSWTEANVP